MTQIPTLNQNLRDRFRFVNNIYYIYIINMSSLQEYYNDIRNSSKRVNQIEKIIVDNEKKVVKEHRKLQSLYTQKQLQNFVSKNTDNIHTIKHLVTQIDFDSYLQELFKIKQRLKNIPVSNSNLTKVNKYVSDVIEYVNNMKNYYHSPANNPSYLRYLPDVDNYVHILNKYNVSNLLNNDNLENLNNENSYVPRLNKNSYSVEEKRLYIQEKLALGRDRNVSLFAKYIGDNPDIKAKHIELINFYYDVLNNTNVTKKQVSPNIIFYPNTETYSDLSTKHKDELDIILDKYKRYYYDNFKKEYPDSGDIPTLSQLTKLDNDVRYGIYKTETGKYLGYLDEDLDRPLELLRRRRIAFKKECIPQRQDNPLYKKALDYERAAISDDELKVENTKKLSIIKKKQLIERAANSIRWGPKDFKLVSKNGDICENPNNPLIDVAYKLNQKNKNNLKFNEKVYVFGFDDVIKKYSSCPKYFRARSMFDPEIDKDGLTICSPYINWQPILNKMFTYFSSKNTLLKFPVCFLLENGKIPFKRGKLYDLSEIFKDNFIGIIRLIWKDTRNGIKHPTETFDLFLFKSPVSYWNTFHNTISNFNIYLFNRQKTHPGLALALKNITYDEFNLFIFYFKMNVWKYNNDTLFLTYHPNSVVQDIMNKTGIKLQQVFYIEKYDPHRGTKIIEESAIKSPYIIPAYRKKNKYGGGNTIIKLDLSEKVVIYDKNIVNEELYESYIKIYFHYIIDVFVGKNKNNPKNIYAYDEDPNENKVIEAIKYSYKIYPYTYITSKNIQHGITIKINKMWVQNIKKLFGTKHLLGKKYDNYSIIKYNPTNVIFFYSWEVLYKFKLIDKSKKTDILEISTNPSFLEACYYYEKKYKDIVSNYNLLYPTKYKYSDKKVNNKDLVEYYINLFNKHVSVNIYDDYFNKDFVFISEKKYDVIYSSLTTKLLVEQTFENENAHLFFNIFCYSINHLNEKGNFVLNVNNITTKAVADIVLLGKKYFTSVIPYQLKIYNKLKTFGTTVIFKDFKGVSHDDNEKLKKIFNELFEYDKTATIYNIVDKSVRKKYKLYRYKFETPLIKDFNYKYINGFLNIPSNSPEYKFIYDFNTRVYLDKISFIEKVTNLKESSPEIQEELKKEYKEQQLIESVLWAKEFDLDTWIPVNKKNQQDFAKIILTDMFSHSKLMIEKFHKPDNIDVKTIIIPDDFERLKKSMFITALNIDTRDIDIWNSIKKEVRFYRPRFKNNKELVEKLTLTKVVSKITGIETISQAWLKMYEIITLFDLFDKNKKVLKSYHICEAPGNFISAIDYYIKTKTNIKDFNWHAQSLNIKTAQVKNIYGFVKQNPNRWDFGPNKSGDITKISNIKYYGEKYCKDISLITSDCGVSFSFDEPEEKFLKLYYSQSLFILLNLPKGANFVAKYIMPIVTNIEISVIYLFYEHFDEVIFYKPLQNYYSREFYIIGKGYNPVSYEMKEKLIEFHNKFNIKKSLIIDFPKNFIYQLVDILEKLTNNWIFHIDRQLYYVDNFKYLNEEDVTLIRQYIDNRNKEWVKRFSLVSNKK